MYTNNLCCWHIVLVYFIVCNLSPHPNSSCLMHPQLGKTSTFPLLYNRNTQRLILNEGRAILDKKISSYICQVCTVTQSRFRLLFTETGTTPNQVLIAAIHILFRLQSISQPKSTINTLVIQVSLLTIHPKCRQGETNASHLLCPFFEMLNKCPAGCLALFRNFSSTCTYLPSVGSAWPHPSISISGRSVVSQLSARPPAVAPAVGARWDQLYREPLRV